MSWVKSAFKYKIIVNGFVRKCVVFYNVFPVVANDFERLMFEMFCQSSFLNYWNILKALFYGHFTINTIFVGQEKLKKIMYKISLIFSN